MTMRDPATTASDPVSAQARHGDSGRESGAVADITGAAADAADAAADATGAAADAAGARMRDEGVAPATPAPQDAPAHEPMAYSADDFRREIDRMKRGRVRNTVIGIIIAVLVVLVVVAVVVFKIPSSLQTVNSDGMTPVLLKGQVVLTKEIDKPTVGEVIAFKDANGAVTFKRVAALAGEWVNVSSDGTIAVSDIALEGVPGSDASSGDAAVIATRQVPDGACFVIADTDASAIEELYKTDNYISYNQIIGRADCRVWPLTNLGPVN